MSDTRAGTGFVPGTPRLAYDCCGEGADVVYLHGIGGNRSNWRNQLEVLSDRFRTIAWDARGYGDSEDYPGDLDFADFTQDLKRLLDHLEIETAHLCGLSMGGRIILDFYDTFPERVKSLILVDTFPGFDASFTQEGRERFVRERRQPLVEGKPLTAIAEAVAPTLVSPAASPEIVAQLVESMCALHPESYIKTIEAMTMYAPVCDVSTITVPVQIIVGADDKLTPPAISQKMHKQIPNAELEIFEDTGHLSNLEQPQRFNATVRRFLESLV